MSLQGQFYDDNLERSNPLQQQNISNSLRGVSVIIPAYNYARYLPYAIESAINQTYSPKEIIVVDDGSTDNTSEVITRFKKQIRYIYQQNSGLPAARNTGIKAARFPFVAFLDADDCWHPDMLQKGMELFGKLDPEFAIVACNANYIDSDGKPLPVNPSVKCCSGEIAAKDILLMTRFPPSSVIAKKNAFEQCGYFDASLKSSEDRDMWLRISGKFRIFLNSERLVFIRKHSANMSSNPERMKENMARVLKKAWQQRIIPRGNFWVWAQALAIHRYQVGLIYLGIGKKLNAVSELTLSLVFYPFPISSTNINSAVWFVRMRTLARALLK
ncbi:MAG: glycosyltransferase family 2 protein [Verrucomicrobiia bacterium]